MMNHEKSDQELYADIMDSLAFQPDLDESDITISVKNGVVTLGGTVNSYPEKLVVRDAVTNVAGVKAVAEEIEVYLPDFAERSDTDITNEAMNALEWSVRVPEGKIKLFVENGAVTLSGTVEWWYQKDAAETAIRNLVGVKRIINNIEIASSIIPREVQEQLVSELERQGFEDARNLTIFVEGNVIRIEGTVRSRQEWELINRVAYAIAGVADVRNDVNIVSAMQTEPVA
jgi:osmotically-inducible protein OsmY